MKGLDLTYIDSICDGDKEMMKEFSDIFIEQVPEFIEELDAAFLKKDAEGLCKTAHKAKSTVSIMGLTDLAEELGKFENETLEGVFSENYTEYINNFKKECLDTVKLLEAYFD